MSKKPPKLVEVFYSYSHKDENLRDELEKHLSILKRQGVITGWHDRRIGAGKEWEGEIDTHLNTAHVILLLISADFLASDYCYDVEMKRAMERHKAGEARVIPVILRPCDWKGAPFGKLQALPKDIKPVTSWPNPDEAFLDVAKGIRAAVKELTGPSAGPPLSIGISPDKSVPGKKWEKLTVLFVAPLVVGILLLFIEYRTGFFQVFTTSTVSTLTLVPPTPTFEPDAVVKAELLSLRSGPGVVYDILEVLKEGDLLTVEGRNLEGDWLKVIASGRREGWAARSPLQVNVDMASVPVIQAPPTPTSVYTPLSTVVPPPELLPPPVLIGPENGAICEGRVFFEWRWDRPLEQNEFFSFRVREEGKTTSCHHGQVSGLRLSVSSLDLCSEGKLYWGVIPVRRVLEDCSIPDEECFQTLSEPSEERWIYYIPGGEPWMWLPTPEDVPPN